MTGEQHGMIPSVENCDDSEVGGGCLGSGWRVGGLRNTLWEREKREKSEKMKSEKTRKKLARGPWART